MNDNKDSGFKSYIDENELESITLDDSQKTKILNGETLVCEANKVLKYEPLSDRKKSVVGVLTVTTFKLSFVSATDPLDGSDPCFQHNLLLGKNDICLSSIDLIYQLGDRNSRKKLTPGNSINGKVKDILIVCKNMRSFEFSFKNCDKDAGKNIVNAILHHAYPKRHSLLFAYDYKEPYHMSSKLQKEVRMYIKSSDWKYELKRTKCSNWRITQVNMNYQVSPLLIEALVVPTSVTDANITQAVEHFRNRCFPVWVWGTQNGAALVRMADLLPTITNRTQENILLEHIRKSHPAKVQPHIIDLSTPTPKDIQTSYGKLRDLCVPESQRQFRSQDFKFYGHLDASKWLFYVSTCLSKAREAAEQIWKHNCTVVLQEGDGQDLNCVVSSLTQILLDASFRTMNGLQSLIQKEWVAMGHPFANRLGHILSKEIEPAPVFLLFLDCIWQLLQQYPHAFQITETYLTTLWDAAHLSLFDTFLFNCQHQRFLAESSNNTGHPPLVLRSVWDWREQFTERDILLFCNPLYDDSFKDILEPHTGLAGLEIWSQCYFRWLPDLEIRHGGRPQIDICSRILVHDIIRLQQQLNGSINNVNNSREEILDLLRKINGFYPFSHNSKKICGDGDDASLENVLLSTSGDLLDSQSILNLNNE